jgi:gamma-glutamylcyclotransferase (GGCT)/AIG2-like uncharacterized protein YtfP
MTGGQHVFVYGTLRRDEVNDIRRLSPPAEFVGFATVRGDLYDYGRHPGIVLNDEGSPVLGEIYRCAPELIALLDDIELNYPAIPGLYRRASRAVRCAGRMIDCIVYELTDDGRHARARFEPADLLDWVSLRLARG